MTSHIENTNPSLPKDPTNPSPPKDIIIRDIFTWLPKEIICDTISRLPFETLMQLRSVSKSCMSLISSPDLINIRLLESNNGVFSWLPKVIIYNILLRLPVETLLRLKSVSKSLLALISDSEFIKTHLLKSTNDPQFTRHHLIISSSDFMHNGKANCDASLDLWELSLYSLLNDPDIEPIGHDYLDDGITGVVGYCNGLVCLASISRGVVYLWNPSTTESRRLPNVIPDDHITSLAYGFCYDKSNDDYKVFSIFRCRSHSNNFENKVSVYSSKTDGSRIISDFPYAGLLMWPWDMHYKGMFANEAMYWVFRPAQESKMIVSLDIKTETFEKFCPQNTEMVNAGGCWALLAKSLSFCKFDSTHADFWVMKKCGSEEFWTKLFTIPYIDRPEWVSRMTMYPNIDRHVNLDRATELSFLKPINVSPNGDIIMMLNSYMQLYNSTKNTYKELFNRGEVYDGDEMGYGYNCDVVTYVESLISP